MEHQDRAMFSFTRFKCVYECIYEYLFWIVATATSYLVRSSTEHTHCCCCDTAAATALFGMSYQMWLPCLCWWCIGHGGLVQNMYEYSCLVLIINRVRFSCLLACFCALLPTFVFLSFFVHPRMFIYLRVPSSLQEPSATLKNNSTEFIVLVFSACVICTLPHLGIILSSFV